MEMGVILLLTLGFATARPPTALVTDTAIRQTKISKENINCSLNSAPGVNIPSESVRDVPKKHQKYNGHLKRVRRPRPREVCCQLLAMAESFVNVRSSSSVSGLG